ncbi:MAG: guanylate kinase [Oscillospiraceae bacterium]|nr:guanylate kinase [Oscillospiraceae bacterium]
MSNNKGKLIVISGPSGTGKGTVISKILKAKPEFAFSVSATTRKPRPKETHGVEYLFIPKKEFKEMISNDEFLEYAEYVGEYYGTPSKYIKDCINSGKTVLLDIEVQGAKQVMERMPEAETIFITAPDMKELEKRLRGRKTDSEEKLIARLARARQELKEKKHYKHTVINDEASRAADEIIKIIDRKD